MGEIPKTHLLAYGAAAVLLIVAGVRFLGEGGDGGSAGEPVVSVDGPAAGTPGGGEGSSRGQLYVHVAGAVRRPGLYRVPQGGRVAAAIERAGGLSRRAELTGVNLAAPLQDGQQVIVPRKGAPGAAPSGAAGPPGPGGGGAPISLATATAQQLEELDGIGPTLARRIIRYRDSHGGFRSVGQLREVEGIGEKRFAALRDAVRP
jgi:competence protein ComEA